MRDRLSHSQDVSHTLFGNALGECVCVYLRQFIVGDVSCVQLDLHFDLVTVHIQSVFALATNEVSP